jgi:DnaJ-class molecular chaperone
VPDIRLHDIIAALGGELKVPSLDGQSSIKIPVGTQAAPFFDSGKKGCHRSLTDDAVI